MTVALNPIVFTEKVVRSFLRYQLTAYPFADDRLHAQILSFGAQRFNDFPQLPNGASL